MKIGERAQAMWGFSKQTFQEWKEDDGPQWGAALAYYTMFSLAPILLISLAMAGLFMDDAIVRERVMGAVGGMLGAEGAELVDAMVTNALSTDGNGLALAIGIAALLVGATGAFAQLNRALNRMWDIRADPKKGGWMRIVRKRVMSFGFVLVIGFLLLVSLVLSTALTALREAMEGWAPGVPALMRLLAFLVSIGIITLLFALIFRYLPDAEIRWEHVWLGAFFTAAIFEVGKWAFGLYLSRASVASGYGAAGSLVMILLWVWFASQVLFLGAEFTQVYARRHGEEIRPEPHAVSVA